MGTTTFEQKRHRRGPVGWAAIREVINGRWKRKREPAVVQKGGKCHGEGFLHPFLLSALPWVMTFAALHPTSSDHLTEISLACLPSLPLRFSQTLSSPLLSSPHTPSNTIAIPVNLPARARAISSYAPPPFLCTPPPALRLHTPMFRPPSGDKLPFTVPISTTESSSPLPHCFLQRQSG